MRLRGSARWPDSVRRLRSRAPICGLVYEGWSADRRRGSRAPIENGAFVVEDGRITALVLRAGSVPVPAAETRRVVTGMSVHARDGQRPVHFGYEGLHNVASAGKLHGSKLRPSTTCSARGLLRTSAPPQSGRQLSRRTGLLFQRISSREVSVRHPPPPGRFFFMRAWHPPAHGGPDDDSDSRPPPR
jgi:hypothetical protein